MKKNSNLEITCSVNDFAMQSSNYSEDWTSMHAANFKAAFENVLGPLNNALEIGSFEGRTSLHFSSLYLNGSGQVLHAVDPHPKDVFWENTAERRASGHISFSQMKSFDYLISRPDYFFDFIYLDGSHIGKHVLQDLVVGWRKLRVGGIMLIDDYHWKNHWYIERLFPAELLNMPEKKYANTFYPKKAVDSFCKVLGPEVEIVFNNYQVCLRRLCDLDEMVVNEEKDRLFCP
ncbi:class I SAM-dependent methyltransferase [Iodobacter sp. HSC-16F04]|uniref:Class I SAM-dependent methyltransferase n=1 Tax=Iodobacter violaceini TaxID=3044271 RepID=A0ABX0KUF8_9NEIS|nr:class I SAM-dependent methyltransferase [Iodobacter violacea]NHQ85782.1 class I SAM-dependent methyltransferase [Iodobacter violacea]